MSFPTWTNALKIPVDEDIVWSHRPSAVLPTSTDPADWEWRRDRRVTFEAVVDMAARYESDFVAYRDSATLTDPVFRYYAGASDAHGFITYYGTWIIDNLGINHTKQGGKTVISVTLLNTSDDEYEWNSR